jgi:hypothetical protein
MVFKVFFLIPLVRALRTGANPNSAMDVAYLFPKGRNAVAILYKTHQD